jgi:hypothetical protein
MNVLAYDEKRGKNEALHPYWGKIIQLIMETEYQADGYATPLQHHCHSSDARWFDEFMPGFPVRCRAAFAATSPLAPKQFSTYHFW